MRLQHYLTEAFKPISPDDIDALIQKECKSFLKQIKEKHVYRGMHGSHTGNIALKGTPRKNRAPKDTPLDMQILFDDLVKKIFGWKPRSQGLFVTGGRYQAETYGTVYEIYPIGNFKFLYAPKVHDFYTEYRGELNLFKQKHSLDKLNSEIMKMPAFIDQLSKFIKSEYKDKNLYDAAMYENEIMILCKSYYAKKSDSDPYYA